LLTLYRIFKDRVKEAEGDEDRARAERDLAKLGAVSPSAKPRSE
jgi:hypothetical protein